MKDESDTTVLLDYTQAGGWNVLPDFAPTTITDTEGVREMKDSPRHNVGSVADPHYVVDEEHYLKAVADADHFFLLSGKYLERANEAEAQHDKDMSDALEQAAKFCDDYATRTGLAGNVRDCAKEIRAMKVEK